MDWHRLKIKDATSEGCTAARAIRIESGKAHNVKGSTTAPLKPQRTIRLGIVVHFKSMRHSPQVGRWVGGRGPGGGEPGRTTRQVGPQHGAVGEGRDLCVSIEQLPCARPQKLTSCSI